MNEQAEGFKLSSEQEFSPLDSSRTHLKTEPSTQNSGPSFNKIKHIYLEEQNTYGRFIPFLLLKDRIHSDLDNSGHAALHHMCSHNSEYIPLYLSTLQKNDPILNLPSKMGHTPLDVAGIYCRKQYIDMLLQKGAIDNGNVDQWAIQGGNICNWTGKVDVTKKHLIHWAAYNDMPEVLLQFYKQGANLQQKDGNDYTPLDLAVINKSYNSIKVLAELGYRAKPQLIKQSQSKSIIRIFQEVNQSSDLKNISKILKGLFVLLFSILSWFLISFTNEESTIVAYLPHILTVITWILLRFLVKVEPQQKFENHRYSAFHSDIVDRQVNLKSNSLVYFLLNVLIFSTGLVTMVNCKTVNYGIAILYFIELYVTVVYLINIFVLTWGVCKNLTHKEMFQSFKCKYLWKQIYYISERRMLMRRYNNSFNKGVKENIKNYFEKNLN